MALYLLQSRSFSHMANRGCFRRMRQAYTRWTTKHQYPTSMEAFDAMEKADTKGLTQWRVMHRGKELTRKT